MVLAFKSKVDSPKTRQWLINNALWRWLSSNHGDNWSIQERCLLMFDEIEVRHMDSVEAAKGVHPSWVHVHATYRITGAYEMDKTLVNEVQVSLHASSLNALQIDWLKHVFYESFKIVPRWVKLCRRHSMKTDQMWCICRDLQHMLIIASGLMILIMTRTRHGHWDTWTSNWGKQYSVMYRLSDQGRCMLLQAS